MLGAPHPPNAGPKQFGKRACGKGRAWQRAHGCLDAPASAADARKPQHPSSQATSSVVQNICEYQLNTPQRHLRITRDIVSDVCIAAHRPRICSLSAGNDAHAQCCPYKPTHTLSDKPTHLRQYNLNPLPSGL